MNCPICKHGRTHPGKVTVTLDRGSATIVFRSVPAEVCENCGEQFVDEATTRELLRQADASVKAGAEIEVRSFAA
ncbi:MAG: type II toxin-antitoxin system MqsA family antitoxin [Planctomycetota bacterium]|nr:type II toxin-antitoxin system MqsA family antitoxin [Planctomycetota bacterium]